MNKVRRGWKSIRESVGTQRKGCNRGKHRLKEHWYAKFNPGVHNQANLEAVLEGAGLGSALSPPDLLVLRRGGA